MAAQERHRKVRELLSFLYPPRCPICGQIPPSGTSVCPDCYLSISFIHQPTCYSCGKPLESEEQEFCHDCLTHPKTFSRGFSLAVYDSVTKPSLSAVKYKNKRSYLQFYADETIKAYGSLFSSLSLDVLLPVPVHPKREKKRGYNQASLFAHSIGNTLSIPVSDSLLIRTINTLPQKILSPAERLHNLSQAFDIHPAYKDQALPFQKVMLIDDIYTTGSTMEALSRLLKSHGVPQIYIFSICIGHGY
ncbi:MAG: ComF family protein [Lachnospiraceae bacterium]|nr:ComF family protein [Lachnospiraceae bacterium]